MDVSEGLRGIPVGLRGTLRAILEYIMGTSGGFRGISGCLRKYQEVSGAFRGVSVAFLRALLGLRSF